MTRIAHRKRFIRIRVQMIVTVDRNAYEAEFNERASVKELRDWIEGEAVSSTQSAIGHVPGTDVGLARHSSAR